MTTYLRFFDSLPVEWVEPDVIRAHFNSERIDEKCNEGLLTLEVLDYNTHLNRRQRARVQEPKCTRSQIVAYKTVDGDYVALAHRYWRRSGEIGGSGRADPKRMFFGGKIIAVRNT